LFGQRENGGRALLPDGRVQFVDDLLGSRFGAGRQRTVPGVPGHVRDKRRHFAVRHVQTATDPPQRIQRRLTPAAAQDVFDFERRSSLSPHPTTKQHRIAMCMYF